MQKVVSAIQTAIEAVNEANFNPKSDNAVIILSQFDNLQKCVLKGNLMGISELLLGLMCKVPGIKMAMETAIRAYDSMQRDIESVRNNQKTS